MKITIYDLIKLIKEDKAPGSVLYNEKAYIFDEDYQDYFNNHEDEYLIYEICLEAHWLDKKVEIIEEEKDIAKIGKSFKANCLNNDLQEQIITIQHNCALAVSKIDELIDEVNKLKKDQK